MPRFGCVARDAPGYLTLVDGGSTRPWSLFVVGPKSVGRLKPRHRYVLGEWASPGIVEASLCRVRLDGGGVLVVVR